MPLALLPPPMLLTKSFAVVRVFRNVKMAAPLTGVQVLRSLNIQITEADGKTEGRRARNGVKVSQKRKC